jgi:bifunctional non-homologous end joining protein LigD
MSRPDWIPPMLATLVAEPFTRDGWIFETKLDGIRCVAGRSGRTVEMLSRNRLPQQARFPEIAKALLAQGPRDFVADGEIVVFDGAVSSFSRLQQRAGPAWLYLFDLMWLDGEDLRGRPLLERKMLLKQSFSFAKPLKYSVHRERDGEAFLREACAAGLEGVIAKDASSPYASGRSRAWQKLKCVNEQELVIGGWTDPEGARSGFGALLVGYYEKDVLRYAGKVGTGFDVATLTRLTKELRRLGQEESPFADKVPGTRTAHWVKPELVAQIGFTEWTGAGRLRHPRFAGLREDKRARDVVRERPRG